MTTPEAVLGVGSMFMGLGVMIFGILAFTVDAWWLGAMIFCIVYGHLLAHFAGKERRNGR